MKVHHKIKQLQYNGKLNLLFPCSEGRLALTAWTETNKIFYHGSLGFFQDFCQNLCFYRTFHDKFFSRIFQELANLI